MRCKIRARVSNRHVHLTEEVFRELFDGELVKKTDLNQSGEVASEQTVTVVSGEKEISRVRVLGPFREYMQIEISKKDARMLELKPPVRRSGEVWGTPKVVLKTAKGEVETDGVIIAKRHVHMNFADATRYGVRNGQKVEIWVGGEKGGMMEAEVKVTENGILELHIDTDDANAFLIEDGDEVEMRS